MITLENDMVPQTTRDYRITDTLAEGETLLRHGKHFASINTFNRINYSIGFDDARLQAMKLLGQARNHLHLYEDQKALQCLDSIDKGVLAISKSTSASAYLHYGFVEKRSAYTLWKSGDLDKADKALNMAINCFQASQYEAELGGLDLPKANAKINEIYAKNLQCHINDSEVVKEKKRVSLLIEAVLCEQNIIHYSPPASADHLTGLTVIADMASSIGMAPRDIHVLSEKSEFLSACRIMFDPKKTWTLHLLEESRLAQPKPVVYAKGLVLAAKLFTKDDAIHCSSLLMRLLDALLSLQNESQHETIWTHRIRVALQNVSIASGILVSRKVFR
jgi:hypothetical protein